ncbi:MAG: FAD-binding oxidoreductase [Clostridia bacterium]|nr:FAD-binding oxidoreductase [Clostridia bacterium]
MKNRADYVIIGGGVSGCSIAYNLAKNGAKNIVVIEKKYICGGSTGACGAGVRMQWGTEMNCKLSKFSIDYYENAAQALDYADGIEFKQKGYLLIAATNSEFDQFKKNVVVQKACGIPSRIVSKEEAKELAPHLNTDMIVGGAFCEKDGFLNPFKTTDAFYRAAKRLGVEFYPYTQVTGITVENGRIKGVDTTQGYIECPVVVNCAGGFSADIAKMAGVTIPVKRERHQILVTEPVTPVQPAMIMGFKLNIYIQQSLHGSFIMGRNNLNEATDGRVTSTWQFLDEMSKTVDTLLPLISKLRVIRQWAGLYAMTPNRQPIYDKAQEVEGMYLACGFSGHGFMFGPVTGVAMADMILGLTPTIDVAPLGLSQFSDKSTLVIEPAVV